MLGMNTYKIMSRPEFPELIHWSAGINVSKHAEARVARAKARRAKRMRNR